MANRLPLQQSAMPLALAVVFLVRDMARARFCAAPILAHSLFVIMPSDIALFSILLMRSCCLFRRLASRSFSCPLSIP